MRTAVADRISGLRADVISRFEQVDQRFDGMDRRFDRMDRRFDRLEGKLDRALAARVRTPRPRRRGGK
jgi:hypothetical protein